MLLDGRQVPPRGNVHKLAYKSKTLERERKIVMKSIRRVIILSVTSLLFYLFIGCGSDGGNENIPFTESFVGTDWQLVSIDGQPIEQLFKPSESEFETEMSLDKSNYLFYGDGSFKGTLAWMLTEKYTDPVTSMTQTITITTEGEYTAAGTTLTILKQAQKINVVVKLEPKAVWEKQIQGKTIESLENDLAAETKSGFVPTASDLLFRKGTQYTWHEQANRLTITDANQNIIFEHSH